MTQPEVRFTGLGPAPRTSLPPSEAVLPRMAERTVTAVTVEVPSYADAFSGRMGQNIENAVQMALGGIPATGGPRPGHRSRSDAVSRARRRLRARSRRGAPGPFHGRTAVGVSGRRAGRLA